MHIDLAYFTTTISDVTVRQNLSSRFGLSHNNNNPIPADFDHSDLDLPIENITGVLSGDIADFCREHAK